MSKRFYLTTAIDYVNGAPHLGHAYEKVVADVIARFHRSIGDSVFFLTGLDEHGQKVQLAAQQEGQSPQLYCDTLADQWLAFVDRLNLSHDDFVRTTQLRHSSVVQALLHQLNDAGHFYKAAYAGFYSVKEETFLTEKDRNPDGTWDTRWGQVNELIEENWYFRMGVHQQWLLQHIEAHPEFIQPDYRRNEVLGFLRSQVLGDLCISRPEARLSWGIPLPFDPSFVTYVWFDALVNYFSVPASLGDPQATNPLGARYLGRPASLEVWPADLHFVGKDILKFHAVYWPIMLHTLGAALPKTILVHGWWQKDGQKLSKSTGNVVDPLSVIDEWGVDAFRYYMTRELGIGPDGNWTDDGFKARYNSELANGLGNLLNRAVNMLNKYRAGIVPPPTPTLAPDVQAAVESTRLAYVRHDPQEALIATWTLVNRANLFVEQTRPFTLAKDPSKASELNDVLYNLIEACRILAVLIWPVMPTIAVKIYDQLKASGEPSNWQNSAWGKLTEGHQIGEPVPLFPRKDLPPKK